MKKISAEDFDRRFDAGDDVSALVNWASARPFASEAAKRRQPASVKPTAVKAAKKSVAAKQRAPR